ncbi:hypothetical protein D3C79_238580 [compost metagenome]
MGRAQAVTDVRRPAAEIDVPIEEVLIYGVVLNDVVGDVVHDRQIGLRREHHAVIRQFEAAVLIRRQHRHVDLLVAQTAIGNARPQDRVHFRHVGAPQHEGVGLLDIVIAAHRLVHAEGAHKAHHRRSHAMAGVRIQVIGAQPGFEQFGGGIAFPHRPLAGAEHTHRVGPLLLQSLFEFFGHDVESLFPTDGGELAFFMVLAGSHPQQRLGQAIFAVHDFRQEIAFDAAQPTVDRRIRIPLRGDDTAILGTDQHTAAGAAEATGRLVPFDGIRAARHRLRYRWNSQPGRRRSGHRGVSLHEVSTTEFHGVTSPCKSCW